MDFGLSEEQRLIQETARAFARDRMLADAPRWDADQTFPVEVLRSAAELGFAAIVTREEVGGAGLGRVDAAIIFEELAAACPSTAAYVSIHNMVCWMVDRFGTAEQRARLLPALVTMEKFSSYCLTEPEAGSDAAALRTRARRDGDGYRISGSKAFISGAGVSDIYVVMARTGGEGAGGVSAFLVGKDSPGLGFGRQERKLGWNSQPTAAVILDDVFVPTTDRLGGEGEGFRVAMQGLDGGRLNIAACSLGGARACLDAARAHLQTRKQFGRSLASFQALRFGMAEMATDLEAARLMVYRGAAALEAGDPDATARCAMAKRFATETGFAICNEALQMHGGYGYLKDTQIERYFRDLRVHRILEGTNEIMQLIIARGLFDGDETV